MRVMLAAIVLGALVAGHVPVRAQQSASDAALHLRIAQRAVEDGEFEIALDEVREAAKIAPTDPVIQFAMATILDKRDKVDEALAALDKAQTLGLPEAYREKADDLRVTLLYKQKKGAAESWIDRLKGTWRTAPESRRFSNGMMSEAPAATLVLRVGGEGLLGTLHAEQTLTGNARFMRGAGTVRHVLVLELTIDRNGPAPVGTLVKGQFYQRGELAPGSLIALTKFDAQPDAIRVELDYEVPGEEAILTLRRTFRR